MAATCPNCASVLPAGSRFCSGCGAAQGGAADAAPPPPPPAARKSNTMVIVLVCIGAAFFLCMGVAVVSAIAIPNLLAAKLSANETAAIATLRNLTSCQAQVQISGRIDADDDGIGEYGTFLEMTGSSGIRKGFRPASGNEVASSDFGTEDRGLSPPILSPVLANVDGQGVVTKSGYCFLLYLPDSSRSGGWTREKGPATSPGFAGGTGRVGVDASETRWCAFAWPVARGNTGNRCFFVDETGNIFACPNNSAKHQGPGAPPAPGSAIPAGRKAPIHGATGTDGEVWTIVN